MIIKKKTWPKYFELVKSGKKKFDLRVADFEIVEGDTLVLEEYDLKTKSYTGRSITKKVGYVLKFNLNGFDQEEKIKKHGFFIIQLED